MRDSLRKSIGDSPVNGFERYAKGSIIICNACAAPIFKLDHAICLGDKAGKMASAFKPLNLLDLDTLALRDDIDSGVRAFVMAMTVTQRTEFLAKLREVRAGDPMTCPVCAECFVQVIAVDKNELLDLAYTLEMVTIPPSGKTVPIRGRRIGATAEWVH